MLGDNDYVQLSLSHTGRSRSIITPCAELIDVSGLSTQVNVQNANAVTAVASTTGSPRLLLELRVHNGAGFSTIAFTFQIVTHSAVPAVLPQFRVYQVDALGNVTPMKSSVVGGYVPLPKPANPTAYHNSGATQTLTYVPDSTFIVDTSKYSYFAEIVDESGAGALLGNLWLAVTCNFSNIQDQQPQ